MNQEIKSLKNLSFLCWRRVTDYEDQKGGYYFAVDMMKSGLLALNYPYIQANESKGPPEVE